MNNMELYNLSKKVVVERNIFSFKEIEKSISKIFDLFPLPENKNIRILLKPNCNNDLNALTGNSTDLRVIVCVINELKKRGYKEIILAEGCNCGINHIGIDVLERLRIKSLGEILNVKIIDLNKTTYRKITLADDKFVKISEEIFKADFVINLPKLKTHVEAGISIATKNLMGCLQGLEKRRIHDNFFPNIVSLGNQIRINLNIVDGIIAMEGNGPGDGIAKKVGCLVAGNDCFLVDAVCAKLMGYEINEIKYLKIKGFSREDLDVLDKIQNTYNFIKAKKNLMSSVLLKNIFVRPRYWRAFDPIFSSGFIPDFLYKIKVRQDVYIKDEVNLDAFEILDVNECNRLLDIICPMELKVENGNIPIDKCLKCMYCYFLDNKKSIKIKGEFGYLQQHIDRFGKFIHKLKL